MPSYLDALTGWLTQILAWPGWAPVTTELRSPVFAMLDAAAVSVCAITGVLAARDKKLDIFGVTVVAIVSALGGGTIRDLLLGVSPVFWISNPAGVVVALMTGWVTFAASQRLIVTHQAFQYPDAFGLGLFTMIGADKAMSLGHGWLVAIMMGVITGVFGGLLRDILCREIPSVLTRTELYATAALAGAIVFVIASGLAVPSSVALGLGLSLTVVIRLCAVRWQIRLPSMN